MSFHDPRPTIEIISEKIAQHLKEMKEKGIEENDYKVIEQFSNEYLELQRDASSKLESSGIALAYKSFSYNTKQKNIDEAKEDESVLIGLVREHYDVVFAAYSKLHEKLKELIIFLNDKTEFIEKQPETDESWKYFGILNSFIFEREQMLGVVENRLKMFEKYK